MGRFIEGEQRSQVTLLPQCLDDFIAEDNPVRVVDAFVEELELRGLGFDGAAPAQTGRPSYHPAVLPQDLHLRLPQPHSVQPAPGARSPAQRRTDVVDRSPGPGLLKTIADFRRDNGAGIRNVCRRFVLLCRELKLFTQASVAVDSSKFKAVNSRDRNFTPAKIDKRQQQIDESIQLSGRARHGRSHPATA